MERWALVTAGAQGLGGAISAHLLRVGYNVLVHYFSSRQDAEALEAAGEEVGARVHLLAADLTNAAARAEMVARARKLLPHGQLHLLVNNLGVYSLNNLLETTIEQWESTLALTLTANFHVTSLALPLLRAARPAARIINIGDSGCDRIRAHDEATAYHVAKLGVHVLTRTYAQQLMPEEITVNMISPGFLLNSVGEPGEQLPAGRPGAFADIIGALEYLTSDSARYVSGANLLVSGAWNL